MSRIKLGQRVKCVITATRGIAVMLNEELNGNIRVSIQPAMLESGVLPEAIECDSIGVDVIDDGVSDRAAPFVSTKIKLGEKVRDIANGFEGVVVSQVRHLNGCVSFQVSGPVNRNGENTIAFIDHERLRTIGEIPELVAHPKMGTGGLMTRSSPFKGRR